MADPVDPQNEIQHDPPFYNVMPNVKNLGIISPTPVTSSQTIKPGSSPQRPPNQLLSASLPRISSHKRLFVIAGIALVILGVGGFFAYTAFFKDDEPTVDDNTPQVVVQPEGVSTPNDWQLQYFGEELCSDVETCGDIADPDTDGLTNIQEYSEQIDPYNPDTDGDGLADGDEVNIFEGSPTDQRSAGNSKFTDGDDARGGFDSKTGVKMTDLRLAEVKLKIKELGLHQPTIETLAEFALSRYDFVEQEEIVEVEAVLPAGVSATPQAMLDRDTQRLASIKKIGAALLAYKEAKQSYPAVTTFNEMTAAIKPYNQIATNYTDPVNVAPFVYKYTAELDNQDFTLNYYSETAKQTVKYDASDAARDAGKESVGLNNEKRMTDLENMRNALLQYSAAFVTGDTGYVFPAGNTYKADLAPNYIESIPKDPSGKDYVYTVSVNKDSFTLKTTIENPTTGATGIICTESEDCHLY